MKEWGEKAKRYGIPTLRNKQKKSVRRDEREREKAKPRIQDYAEQDSTTMGRKQPTTLKTTERSSKQKFRNKHQVWPETQREKSLVTLARITVLEQHENGTTTSQVMGSRRKKVRMNKLLGG